MKKMVVAIDLNDVVRAYTRNFAKVYQKEYDRTFDNGDLEITTNDLSKVFPFDSEAEYKRFVYQDYPYELFGKCETVDKMTSTFMNTWIEQLKNHDIEENIDVLIVSPMEYGLTIQSTYFFLSKIGCKVREVYFPTDSLTIWDRCDVLVTANPKLLNNKPEGKKVVKITADYNHDCEADDTYTSACEFFEDTNNTLKFI
jgi:hypothetical protein